MAENCRSINMTLVCVSEVAVMFVQGEW